MRLRLPGVKGMDHGETRNVSAGGIYLHTRAPLVAGQDLECVLVLPQDLTRTPRPMYVGCRGKVIRVHERMPGQKLGVALEITGYDFSWPDPYADHGVNEIDA